MVMLNNNRGQRTCLWAGGFAGLCTVIGLAVALNAARAEAAPFAYVTNRDSNSVSVIDTATNTPLGTVTVGVTPFFLPTGVGVSPDGKRAYVTNQLSSFVSVIDTASNSVVTYVNVSGGAY
jgi:YVTN family beta-propeller protein